MPYLGADITTGQTASTPRDIVGILRFSLILERGNYFPNIKELTFEERVAEIFNEERLERRFEVFESICLPSLLAQSDQNFNAILVTSKMLPAWAQLRLNDLVRNTPNIYVKPFRAKADIKRIFKRAAFEMLDPSAPVIGTFQLDDDDALSEQYIEKFRQYIKPENAGKVLTFRNGFELSLETNNMELRFDDRAKASAGLASIHMGQVKDVNDIKTIYQYGGHRKVDQKAPLIIDESPDMYLQTANGFNVSGRTGKTRKSQLMGVDEILAILRPSYPYLSKKHLKRASF